MASIFSWSKIRAQKVPDISNFIRAKERLKEKILPMVDAGKLRAAGFVGSITHSDFDPNFRSDIDVLIVSTTRTDYREIEELKDRIYTGDGTYKGEGVVVNDIVIDEQNPGKVDRISRKLFDGDPLDIIGTKNPLDFWYDVDPKLSNEALIARYLDERMKKLKENYPDPTSGDKYYWDLSTAFDTSRSAARKIVAGLTNTAPSIREDTPGARIFRLQFGDQPSILQPFDHLIELDAEYWYELGEAMTGNSRKEQYEEWLLKNGILAHEAARALVSELARVFPLDPEVETQRELERIPSINGEGIASGIGRSGPERR